MAAALAYTGGPAYGYRGLGEVFVFVFFGLVATVGSRFVHDRMAPRSAWLLAVPVGLLATAILVANNVRDIDTDRGTGKRTLAVLLGRQSTRHLYAGLLACSFAVLAATAGADWVPRPSLLGLAAVPFAVRPVLTVYRETEGRALIGALGDTARLHALFGLLVAVGAAVGSS
jgi:1,4-dihydroxy-2-naphthoate octaprenyltransferase